MISIDYFLYLLAYLLYCYAYFQFDMILPVYHKHKVRTDSILAFSVLVLPFLGYLHLLFDGTENSILIFGFELASTFPNISIHIWYFLSKIIPVLLLSIWFWNCDSWWRYFIFSPILLNTFTLSSNGFNFENLIGTFDWISALLFSVIVGISIVLIDLVYFGFSYRKHINRSLLGIFEEREFYIEICNRYIDIKRHKREVNEDDYPYKLYHIKTLLKQKISKFESITSRIVDEKHKKFNLVLGLIILFIPALFYSNTLIPKGLKEITYLGITIDDNGFQDVNTFYWFLLLKLCIILPLIIWFVTTKYWWKYSILSPIILFSYQFWEANLDTTELDSYGNIKILPLIIFVLLFVLMLAKLTKYRARIMELYSEINNELDITIYNLALSKDQQLLSLIQEFSLNINSSNRQRRKRNITDLFEFKHKLMLKMNKEN